MTRQQIIDGAGRYFEQAHPIYQQMWAMSDKALHNQCAVNPEFYTLQNKLNKVYKNYRAYCRKHGIADYMPHYLF